MHFATRAELHQGDVKVICRYTALILIALTSCAAFSAAKKATTQNPRNWSAKDFEQMKTQKMPILVYIADTGYKNNPRAKLFETDLLDSAEAKDKLKAFACIFMDSDGKRAKGWPADITSRGANGAAILMMSSDMRYSLWIDKSTPKELLNGKTLQQQMQLVADYQAKLNTAAQIAAKKNEEEQKMKLAAKPPEEKVKGLEGILDGVGIPDKKDKGATVTKDGGKKNVAEPLDE